MQNATDAGYENEKISVQIILNYDKLEFKLNGQYFKINNIIDISQQVSSKNSLNLEGQTGKFGTSFIGINLLSDIIYIKGILLVNENNFREFEKRLDRSEKNSEQLASNNNQSQLIDNCLNISEINWSNQINRLANNERNNENNYQDNNNKILNIINKII